MPPVAGPMPANVVIDQKGTGEAKFSTTGIVALAPNNTITLENASVYFDNSARSASALKLGGGKSTTADPPAANGNAQVMLLADSVLQVAFPLQQFSPASVGATPSSANTTLPVASQLSHISSGPVETLEQSQVRSPLATAESFDSLVAANSSIAAYLQAPSRYLTGDACWSSDTELDSREIPALLSSDEELGVRQATTVVSDFCEVSGMIEPGQQVAGSIVSAGNNLKGAVELNASPNTARGRKTVKLTMGSVVLAPRVSTIVETPLGRVFVAPKSLVLIMAFRSGLAVYDLHDLHSGAVRLMTPERNICLHPGFSVLVSSENVGGFEQINPAQLFGYRNIRTASSGQGRQMFTAEFSIMQALRTVQPVKQLIAGRNHRAQGLASEMLRTACILEQMNTTAPQFQQVPRLKQQSTIAE